MKDLAILVDNKNDSTEAQDLLFSMGYKWRGLGEISKSYFYPKMNKYFIFMNKNEMDLQMAGYFAGSSRSYAESRFKEITIQKLRDLVVLKRNDVGDATHKGSITDNVYYVSSDEEVYRFESSAWCFSTVIVADLKPIEKKEMKEYLDPENGYKLNLTDRPFFDWIEIPEGANFAWKSDSKYVFFTALEMGYRDAAVVWSRHTHPEELPFIDDEPKITTAKGSELDYIAKIHDMRDRYNGESDEDYRYQLEHYISRKEPSLNDQYAEIEKVRQSHRTASETADPTIKETLSQRQEQYGSFEDVAMFTEQMVDVMRKGYYEKLAYNQKMALYMICSKMARIVNGNPNHKDSWHDIAGYATLIDNELVSEKDMPF